MSDPSAEGPLSEDTIQTLQNSFGQVAAVFVFWGIQLCLATQACYILLKRGLRTSRSRRNLMIVVLVMLGSSTAFSATYVDFLILQMPTLGADPPDVTKRLLNYMIAWSWLERLNFCLSDTIVVWRAWALWSRNSIIRYSLGVCLAVTWASSTVDAVLVTLGDRGTGTLSSDKAWNLHLELLMYIPMLVTNIYATGLISYRAWLYRTDIRAFLDDKKSSTSGHSGYRVERILALLIETGGLYIVFWILYMLIDYDVPMKTRDGMVFGFVWQAIMVHISAIYPTVIILLVSQYMSQGDLVYSSEYRTGQSPPADARQLPMSTIKFHTPLNNAQSPSSTTDYTTGDAGTRTKTEPEFVV